MKSRWLQVAVSIVLLFGTLSWSQQSKTTELGPSHEGSRSELPHYVFVLPDGYVGWIQVIFLSPGAPELKPDHGKFILRINEDGVFRTSMVEAVFAGSHDEFLYRSLRPDGTEALKPVPATYFCGEDSGIDSCFGSDGTKSDGFTVGRANLGKPNDGTPGNSWFIFVGPSALREKYAKPITRAPGAKYQIDVPENDPTPGMIRATN
jgi:hypothetical protein